MADKTVALTPGVGESVAFSSLGGPKGDAQVIKLDLGADAASSPLVRGQQTKANSLPVALASDQGAVTVDGSGVTQPVSATSLPLPTGAATEATLANVATSANQTTLNTNVGGLAETVPATDTASSGLNGRLQRIAQRLTSIIGLLPTALGAGGGLKVDGSGTPLPVSGTVTANAGTNLNTSALALETGGNLATLAGAVSSSKMAVKAAAADFADGAVATIGLKADAKSTATDTTAITAMSVWKQISASVQLMVFGAGTAAAAQRTTLASDDPAVAALGAISGAAVITDANGTIQQYLRGLVKQWIAGTLVLGTGANVIGALTANQSVNNAQINGVAPLMGNGASGTGAQRVTIASDSTGQIAIAAGSAVVGQVFGAAGTAKTSVTRPADTNVYAANDAWADSTTVPTAGGFTLSNMARASGGSGIITDLLVSSSNDPATLLQGELWILDQAGTAINDNAAFAMADADVLNVIAVVPFTLASTQAGSGANSFAHIQNLSIGYTCVGTANLRFLVKVKNAYTPASAEKLQVAAKFIQTN